MNKWMNEGSQIQNTNSSFQPASYNCRVRRPAFYFSEQQGSQAKDSSHRGNAYFLAV